MGSAHDVLYEIANANHLVVDPGSGVAITVPYWNATVPIAIGSGSQTNTLAAPIKAGLRLRFVAVSDAGGSRAITVASEINQTGNTIMTFADVEDMIVLESFPSVLTGSSPATQTYRWRVVANDGVGLS